MTRRCCQSLRFQVGAFLLSLALLSGSIFFFGWLPHFHRTSLAEQRSQVGEHLTTLTDALLPYLIQDQLGAVHETLNALLERQPTWRVLTLTGQRGERLYPLFPALLPEGSTIFRLNRDLHLRGQSYGRLTLYLDASPLLAKSRQRGRELAAIFFGVMFAVFLFIALFLELIAGRPTRQLARAAEGVAEGVYEARLPAPRGNEVGELTRSFDLMRETIRAKETSLIEARRQAESANRAKSMFLANMSHELRTPLNSVLGFAQLMAADPEASQEQRERLDIIQRGGGHLLDLLNDLLDLSKIEAGTVDLETAPVDLPALLSDIENMFRTTAEAKGLRFVVTMTEDLPGTVLSDPRKIRQILLNLTGNALKFTDHGSVEVRASYRAENLMVEVTDTGPGIPAEKLDSIFQPFERAEQKLSNRDGAGLGLAICKRFTELLGGDLRVTSRADEGSTFTARIPATRAGSLQLPDDGAAADGPLPPPNRPKARCNVSVTRIPHEILASLADACASLDFAAVNHELARVKLADPEAHGHLAELADAFRYEELEVILRNSLNLSPHERQAA